MYGVVYLRYCVHACEQKKCLQETCKSEGLCVQIVLNALQMKSITYVDKHVIDPVSMRSNRTGGKFVLLILETFDAKISIKCEKNFNYLQKIQIHLSNYA